MARKYRASSTSHHEAGKGMLLAPPSIAPTPVGSPRVAELRTLLGLGQEAQIPFSRPLFPHQQRSMWIPASTPLFPSPRPPMSMPSQKGAMSIT